MSVTRAASPTRGASFTGETLPLFGTHQPHPDEGFINSPLQVLDIRDTHQDYYNRSVYNPTACAPSSIHEHKHESIYGDLLFLAGALFFMDASMHTFMDARMHAFMDAGIRLQMLTFPRWRAVFDGCKYGCIYGCKHSFEDADFLLFQLADSCHRGGTCV